MTTQKNLLISRAVSRGLDRHSPRSSRVLRRKEWPKIQADTRLQIGQNEHTHTLSSSTCPATHPLIHRQLFRWASEAICLRLDDDINLPTVIICYMYYFYRSYLWLKAGTKRESNEQNRFSTLHKLNNI